MRLKRLSKTTFEKGNTCVVGLRGCGKDMLFANIISLQNRPYISNCDYKVKDKKKFFFLRKPTNAVYIPLDISKLDCSKNSYVNFIEDSVIPYDYPYPEKCDIYISDCGVYFPSQYCNQLNNKYPYMSVFEALSRQIGNCNMHINVQNLNRCWDKIREQSDIYIQCDFCKVLFGKFVIQKITIYDKYESCVSRVKPYKHIRKPILSSGASRAIYQTQDDTAKRNFTQTYGMVKSRLLIYKNRSNYDTRLFKSILGGKL